MRLLINLARPALDDTTRAETRKLLQGPVSWNRFLDLADAHALTSLVRWTLSNHFPGYAPLAVRTSLESHYREAAIRQLQYSGELLLLLRELTDQGIPALAFKGPALAFELYGEEPLREYCDLDLLVHPEDVTAAGRVLRGRGFTTEIELENPAAAPVVKYSRQAVFCRADGIAVDLHWQLRPAGIPAPFTTDEVWSRMTTTVFRGTTILSMPPEQLLLYLCMHGGKHRWRQLSWLSDLARFLRIHDKHLDWGFTMVRIQQSETQAAVLAGLKLANSLLDAPLPEHIQHAAAADSLVRRLSELVIESYEAPAINDNEPTVELRFQHLPWLSGWRQRSLYLARLAFAPSLHDWRFARLPQILFPLYYLLRPIRLLCRHGLPYLFRNRGRPARSDVTSSVRPDDRFSVRTVSDSNR